MSWVKISSNGRETEVFLHDGDMRMRATGDIYVLRWDEDIGRGRVERWNHATGEFITLERGGELATAGCWHNICNNLTAFEPTVEQLGLVNYPKGGKW